MAYTINPDYVLFQHGERKKYQEGELYCEKIGEVTLTSGEIVVCDPLIGFYERPLAKQVTPGTYSVFLTICRFENDDERVAYATLQFNTNKVVRWKMALWEGNDVENLEDNHFYGYGVDAGIGCFVDNESKELIIAFEDRMIAEDEDFISLYDYLEVELQKNYKHTRDWLVTKIDNKASIAMFSSGWGDGVYPSFWGYDENGEVVCLVTDFLVTE